VSGVLPARLRTALLLALLLFLAFLTLQLIMDDLWTDLALGRQMVEQRGIPTRDDFTFGENDRPWMPHLWLSELCMYLTYAAAGLEGIRWFFLLAAFLYLAAVARFYRSLGLAPWGVAFGVCCVFAISLDRFRHRPVIFEMIFVYVVVAFLVTFWSRLTWRHLLGLYLLTALFVNLHSGAVLGPVLVGAWAVGDDAPALWRRERPTNLALHAGAVLAAVLGSLTTPNHVRLWFYIFGPKPVLARVPEYFSTLHYFRAGAFHELPLDRVPVVLAPWLVMLLILAPCLGQAGALARRPQPGFAANLRGIAEVFPLTLPQALLSLPLLYLSARHLRFIYMAGVPLGFLVGRYRERIDERRAVRWVVVAATVACLSFVTWDRVRGAVYCATHPREHVLASAFPLDGTRFLAQRKVHGRIFSDPMWSTYLLFRLYPDCRTFYDMRNIYGGLRVVEEAEEIAGAGPRQEELLQRYDIDVIVSRGPFAFGAHEAPRWRLVFHKEQAPYEYVYLRVGATRTGEAIIPRT